MPRYNLAKSAISFCACYIQSLAENGEEVPVDKIEEQIITSTKVNIPSRIKLSLA